MSIGRPQLQDFSLEVLVQILTNPVMGTREMCALAKTSRSMHATVSTDAYLLNLLFRQHFPYAPDTPDQSASGLWENYKLCCRISFNTQNNLPFVRTIQLDGLRFENMVQLRNGHVAGALKACGNSEITLTQGSVGRRHPVMGTIDPSVQNPREQINLSWMRPSHPDLSHTIELPNEKIVYTQGSILIAFDPKTGTPISSSTPFWRNRICGVMAIPGKNKVVVNSAHKENGIKTIRLINLELKEEQIVNFELKEEKIENHKLKDSQIEKLDLDRPETFTILPDGNIAVLCRGPDESDCILVLNPETKEVLRQKSIPNPCADATHLFTRPFTALPCGSIILGQPNGIIEIHDLETGESNSCIAYADASRIAHIQVLSQRHIALIATTTEEGDVLKIWDSRTGMECASLSSLIEGDLNLIDQSGNVARLYPLPNGEIIILTNSQTLNLWNPQTNTYTLITPPELPITPQFRAVLDCAYSQPSNGRFITASDAFPNSGTDLCFFDFDGDYGHTLTQIAEGIRGNVLVRDEAEDILRRMPPGIQQAVYGELPLWEASTPPEKKSQAILAYLKKRGTKELEWGPPLSPILEPGDEPAAAPVAESEAESEPRSAGSRSGSIPKKTQKLGI